MALSNFYRAFLFFVSFKFVLCIIDDCNRNRFSSNNNQLQFTKELPDFEFAVVGKFKGLHCCAKGYRSVEWVKESLDYPWISSISSFILYPESVNQTIYTQRVTMEDAGNYTCFLRNDTTVVTHTVNLKVYDKAPNQPFITYVSNNKEVTVGNSVRLFCEAFVGVVDLPDAFSEAIWRRDGDNGSLDHSPHIHQEKVSREDGLTLGTYLTIDEISEEDFGEYICKIKNPVLTTDVRVFINEKVQAVYLNHNPFPWQTVSLWMIIISLIIFTLFILNMKFGLPIRVRFKDRFGQIEDHDGKSIDVLVLYSERDSEFVLQILLPNLESDYKCIAKQLPPTLSTWCTSFAEVSKDSRRLIAVLSPSALDNCWDTTTIYETIRQLSSLNNRLICITLEDLPKKSNEPKNSGGENLSSIFNAMQMLRWRSESIENFFLSLKLSLPARRNNVERSIDLIDTQPGRLNNDSQESLDVLV